MTRPTLRASLLTKDGLLDIAADQTRRLPFTLAAGLAGGLLFTWMQVLTGTNHIAEFIGGQIAMKGGYAEALASPIGWTVHLAIAVAYAALFSLVYTVFFRGGHGTKHHAAVIAAAIGIGWVTTWISNPAISITIALLAGQGLPTEIFPVYFKLGVPLYNHLLFFVFAAGVVGYAADAFIGLTARTLGLADTRQPAQVSTPANADSFEVYAASSI